MNHQIKKTILAATILAILLISQTVSAAPLHPMDSGPVSQFMYDNFDDNFTDPSLWYIELRDSGPTASEVNQRLELTLPADSAGDDFAAWYDSVCQLRGDYDIQVDYEALNWPLASGARIGLTDNHANMHRVSSGTQPNDYPGGPDFYMTIFDTPDHVVGITPTSDLSGKLRLQRVGDTINTFYFADGGWVLDASNSDPAYTADTPFALGAWSADSVFTDQEVKLAFDNLIINYGELVCPSNEVPSVTVDQASGQADPTSGSPVLFTATFSEPVTGFGDAAADVTLSGTAGATTATVTETAPNDGTTYTVSVSGMTASGTVIASVPAGAAVNASNGPNTASISSDNTVTYNMSPAGQITPNTATCEQFAAGSAPDLDTATYNLIFTKKARVSEVIPLTFHYYSKVIAPAASFQIKVVQSANSLNWHYLVGGRSTVYNPSCTPIMDHTSTGRSITFNVTNATPGAAYYVGTVYLTNSIQGTVVTYPYPTVRYGFTTMLNNTILRTSFDIITFGPR